MAVGRRGLRRLLASAAASVLIVYVGIGVVAVSAVPVLHGHTALSGADLNAPVLGIVERFHPHWLEQGMRYAIAAAAVATLVAAANAGMLGLSRLAYSLATNRQIPSTLGQLHPRRFTPFVVIAIAALIAAALVAPADLDFLVGIYAFGAMLAFTIAHLSIIVLRYREPDRDRPYRIPFSIDFRGASLPLPAVLRRARLGRRLGQRGHLPRAGPLRRQLLDAVRARRCTWSTGAPRTSRSCAASPCPPRRCAPSTGRPQTATTARCSSR